MLQELSRIQLVKFGEGDFFARQTGVNVILSHEAEPLVCYVLKDIGWQVFVTDYKYEGLALQHQCEIEMFLQCCVRASCDPKDLTIEMLDGWHPLIDNVGVVGRGTRLEFKHARMTSLVRLRENKSGQLLWPEPWDFRATVCTKGELNAYMQRMRERHGEEERRTWGFLWMPWIS